MTLTLLKNKFRGLRKMGAKLSFGQKVTAGLFQLVILSFMLFLGAFFGLAFYVLRETEAGAGAVIYLLDHLFFLIFALAVVSGAISSLYTMFRAKEIPFLVGLPLPSRTIFDYLFIQILVFNTWPVIIVGIPLVLAFTIVFKIGIVLSLALAAGLFPLTLIAEAAGLLLAIGGMRAFRRLRLPLTVGLVVLLGLGFSYYLADAIAPTRLNQLINESVDSGGAALIENQQIDRVFLPNYWLSQGFKSGLEGDGRRVVSSIAVLWAATIAAVGVARYLGGRVYLGTWMRSQEVPARTRIGTRRSFPRFLPGLRGALVERDYLAFSRSSNEVSQAFFFFMLVLILVIIVSRYPRFDADSGIWAYRAVVMLFGVVAYYLVMLANRFVFPSLGLEGRSFWILLSSPLKLGQLFRAKLSYSVAILVVLGVTLALVSAYFFRVPYLLTAAMLLWVIPAGAVIAAISLAIGTLYPDFSRQSPAELSSSLAGLVATVISLLYGAVAMALFAPVAAIFYLGETYSPAPPILIMLIGSVVIFAYLRHISLKKLADFHL